MLTAVLSDVEQISFCKEGVMGFHNDRRTERKMPANDSSEVISLNVDNICLIYVVNSVNPKGSVF